MSPLSSSRFQNSEEQAFFNESRPSRWASTFATLIAFTTVASTIVTLFTI
jgi:hypothetical protein